MARLDRPDGSSEVDEAPRPSLAPTHAERRRAEMLQNDTSHTYVHRQEDRADQIKKPTPQTTAPQSVSFI